MMIMIGSQRGARGVDFTHGDELLSRQPLCKRTAELLS